MDFHTVILGFLLIFQEVSKSNSKNTINFKHISFVSARADFNKSYLLRYSMSLREKNRFADIVCHSKTQLPLDTTILVTLKIPSAKNIENMPTMFQMNVKVCDFLGKNDNRVNGFLLPFLKRAFKNQQFPKRCPIMPANYSLIGFNLDDLKIPPFLPNSKYDVTVFLSSPKQSLGGMIGILKIMVAIS